MYSEKLLAVDLLHSLAICAYCIVHIDFQIWELFLNLFEVNHDYWTAIVDTEGSDAVSQVSLHISFFIFYRLYIQNTKSKKQYMKKRWLENYDKYILILNLSLWEFSYDIRYEHSKKYIILHGLTLVLASRNLLKALLSKMKIFSKYCHARIAIHLRMTSRYMTLNHDSKCNIFRINNKTKSCNSYFIACKDSCFQENKIFEARVK